jgi:hypothetical protein
MFRVRARVQLRNADLGDAGPKDVAFEALLLRRRDRQAVNPGQIVR